VKRTDKARQATLYRQRREIREALHEAGSGHRATELRQRQALNAMQLVQLHRRTA
jgi:hypothetical protein